MDGRARAAIADVLLQRGAPGDVALVDATRRLTYADLNARVTARAADLDLAARSVVLLTGTRSIEWVVTYLAILQAGHVPLLAGSQHEEIASVWSPALALQIAGDELTAHRPASVDPGTDPVEPGLHPELALLLSTSGSTGSPKLVRLSHQNLVSNAHAIVSALDVRRTDVAITSLPLHYCFGLSVLHSHLAAGATVVMTDASVVDPCFAAAMRNHRVTSLAAVPHTLALLDAGDPERLLSPSLRQIAQAGGAMAPDLRSRWRRLTQERGIDLVVMYGQTEATARMAVLPPSVAEVAGPMAVGMAVPGGSLRVDAPDGDRGGVGELVYQGPNVMMGYATAPADLAQGPQLTELRTGDRGRFDPEHGVFEVVGRISRFAKPLGLRVDLDRLEAALAEQVGGVAVAGDDELIAVAAPGVGVDHVRSLAAQAAGLPPGAIEVLTVEPPRTDAGKVDQRALVAQARAQRAATAEERSANGGSVSVSALLAEILGRDLRPTDTFASAGGDSLSYVEASLRIEERLGTLPADWQHQPVGELDAIEPGRPDRRVDTTVVMRALGICLVVSTHMKLLWFPGGAHLLLVVAGYNLSRFQLGIARAADRVRSGFRTVARVALPTVACAVGVMVVSDLYDWPTVALVNNYLGHRGHQNGYWHFWFIEAYVQITVLVTLVLAIPVVRRAERRAPYVFAFGALVVALAARDISWAQLDDPLNLRFRTHGVAWFVALGWLAHRSRTPAQRLMTTALCLAVVPGFFGLPQREWFIVAGLLVLLWMPRVRLPAVLVAPVAAVAAASMWILISHFHVWPWLTARLPLPAAYIATLAVGVGIASLAQLIPRHLRKTLAARSRVAAPTPAVTPGDAPVPAVAA